MEKVYISGAITGNENHYEQFENAELWLRLNGYSAINPVKVASNLPDLNYEDLMQVDFALISLADSIFMLDGWQKSKGACAELHYARALGKKVLYQDYYKEFRKRKENKDNE